MAPHVSTVLVVMFVNVYLDTMAVNVSIISSDPPQSVLMLLVKMEESVAQGGMILLACVHRISLVKFVKSPPQLKGDVSAIPVTMVPLVQTPHRGQSAHAR